MVVGCGLLIFRLHDCRSLKAKRSVVKSIVAQIRNNFNVSAAEVDSNDVYERAEIGVSMVGNDRALINSKMDKLFNMADELGLAQLTDTQMEIISL